MKNRKLITALLLMAMSFSMLHAFAISFLEEDHHTVHEYVQEFSEPSLDEEIGEVCDIHHEFHMLYLLPEPTPFQTDVLPNRSLCNHPLSYQFQMMDNFLKPPIV